jgi:hypothetical protein
MLEYVNDHNFMSDFQSGFSRRHNTMTASIRDIEDLGSAKAEGKVMVYVLEGFSPY